MNNTHSQTPWSNQGLTIEDAKGFYIGRVESMSFNSHRNEANAAHICLCVNAHEELKQKLSDLAYAASKLRNSDRYHLITQEVDAAMVLLENVEVSAS